MRSIARRSFTLLLPALFGTFASIATAQLPTPQLDWIFPAGAKAGGEIEVSLSGNDLDDGTKLYFSHPGITAKPKMSEPNDFVPESRPLDKQFLVSVAGNVPAGIYDVHFVGRYGMSNPRSFQVGVAAEIIEAGADNAPDAPQEIPLNATVNGRTGGDSIDWFQIKLTKGQRITVDAYAFRIDSKADLALELVATDGKPLVSSYDALRRDPQLRFEAPADGNYRIKCYDSVYAGGNDYFYRLHIHTRPVIDFVFPPAVAPGAAAQLTAFGWNLPSGSPATELGEADQPIFKQVVSINAPAFDPAAQLVAPGKYMEAYDIAADGFEYRLPSDGGASNPVFISFATGPLITEASSNDEPQQAQPVELPCEFVGQFYPRGDADWLQFTAKKGEQYWLEVISQRLGLPTDPYLLVEKVTTNEEGEAQVSKLKDADDWDVKFDELGFRDFPADPRLLFEAPEDATYRVLVRDNFGSSRSDPRMAYRLSVRPAQPDFRLVASLKMRVGPNGDKNKAYRWNPTLRKGGTCAVRVYASRHDGYDGPIELIAEGLPAGVTCPPTVIGTGQNEGDLLLHVADSAADWSGAIRIVGSADIAGAKLRRQASCATVLWDTPNDQSPAFSRQGRELALAVVSEVAPLEVRPKEMKTWETARAGKLEIPIQVTRRGDVKGELQLQPVGLPAQIKVANVKVAQASADGKVEVAIDRQTPPGTYCFYLQGQSKFNYARNPEAAAQAEADKKKVEEVLALRTKAKQEMEAAQQAAEKKGAEAAARLTQLAGEEKQLAQQQQAATQQAEKTAAEAKRLADEAAQKTDDTNLAQARDKAKQAADEAAAQAAAAKTALEAKQKELAEAQPQSEAANAEMAAAKQAAEGAMQAEKQAQEEKTRADKLATDLTNAAKPKDIDTFTASLPIVMTVYEAPLRLNAAAPAGPIKQAATGEVSVLIERLIGYADAVEIQGQLPGGVSGIALKTTKIEAGQNEVKLAIEANAQATPGTHQITIRAKLQYNGQALEVTQEIPVTIEAVEPAPK